MRDSRSLVNPSLFKQWSDFNLRRANLGRAPIAYDWWYNYTYGEKSGEGQWKSNRERDQEWLAREETNFAEKESQRDAYICYVTDCINKSQLPEKYDDYIIELVTHSQPVEHGTLEAEVL